MWIHHLSWEKSLPDWLATHKIQWIPWAYAIFQTLRTHSGFLFLISYIPFTLFRRCTRRDVVALAESHKVAESGVAYRFANEKAQSGNTDEEEEDPWLYFLRRRPTTFQVWGRGSSWPHDWIAVKFKNYFYLIHIRALRAMRSWISISSISEERVIFMELQEPEYRLGNILSRDAAYEKIFSGKYCVEANNKVIGSVIDFIEINNKLWAVLSSLPALLQAAGAKKTSMLLSLIIIVLDINRSWLYRIYLTTSQYLCRSIKMALLWFSKERSMASDSVDKVKKACLPVLDIPCKYMICIPFAFLLVLVCILLAFLLVLICILLAFLLVLVSIPFAVFVSTPLAFLLIFVFPTELYPTDKLKGKFYLVSKGEELNIQPFSKFKALAVVTFTGSGVYNPLEKKSYVRIWEGRGLASPMYMKSGDMYGTALMNRSVFVE